MSEKIDLNQADASALAFLPGIGEKLAERIVEYRQQVRPFAEVIELAAVPGISERMVREIEGEVMVAADMEQEPLDLAEELPVEERPEESEPVVAPPEEETAPTPVAIPAVDIGGERPVTMPPMRQPLEGQVSPVPGPVSAPPRSGFREHLLTAVIGALLGTVLTLAVISLLNGSLQLNESERINFLERQSAMAAATLQADQGVVRGDFNRLDQQVATLSTRESETTLTLESVQNNLASTQDELIDNAERMNDLENTAKALDDRITVVAGSAENFDFFLDSLRDLLWDLQGPPPTPTATVTPAASATMTTTAGTPVGTTPTATPFVTRTPRPTATPLGAGAPTVQPTPTATE